MTAPVIHHRSGPTGRRSRPQGSSPADAAMLDYTKETIAQERPTAGTCWDLETIQTKRARASAAAVLP
jgi:hypothetical protein